MITAGDFDDFDDFFDSYDDDLSLDEYSSLADKDGGCFDDISSTPSECNPVDILTTVNAGGSALVDGVVDAINLNPYLHTRPPQTRYIGDNPLFIMWNNNKSFLTGSIFLNFMDKMFFSKNGDTINHYLALSEENTTRVVGDVGKAIGVDLATVLRLFENFKLREVKLGVMLQGRKQFGKGAYMGFQLPVYYIARHYNATQQEINKIEENNIFGNSGSSSSDGVDDDSFIREHFIGDMFGCGDFRFNVAYKFWEQDTFMLTIGTQVTVPMSMGHRGVYGANFNLIPEPAFLNLEKFLCDYVRYEAAAGLNQNTKAAELNNRLDSEKKRFGTRVLDWLSTNLLNPPLGQEKQWSWGFFIEPQCHLQENISVKTRLTLDYLFGSSNTIRYLLVQRDLENLSRDIFNTTDLSQPDDKISQEEASNRFAFLSEAIQEKFGPNRGEGTVDGRLKVEFTIAPEFRFTDNWTLMLGYDYWYIQKESLSCFNSTYTNNYKLITNDDLLAGPKVITLLGNFQEPQEVSLAERPSAHQSKIFGILGYKRYTKNHDITLSLGGDLTVGSVGIGKDFTLKAGLTLNF